MFAQNGRIALQTTKGAKQECTKNAFTGFSATFSFSSIESVQVSTEKGVFSAISIDNAFPSGEEGSPSLPAARQLIAVPFGANPTVKVKSYSTSEYLLSDYDITTLMPQQPSVRKDVKPEDVKFSYNASSYQATRFSERELAQVEVLGTMRGMQIGVLTINPISYNPSTNTIRVYNDIEVEVSFEGADLAKTQSIYQNTYSLYFEPVYRQMFNRSVYDDHPDLWNAPIHMLVIANRMFENALQPWLEWKTQKGFYLDVNYTDNIGSNYNAIKTFITNKYNEGVQNGAAPTFVAIIGDVAQVPNTTGTASQKVTDLYYASVDGDYFPDMYEFRMSAENASQLTAMINKALMYEKYTMPDPSYLSKALLIAGADGNWNPKIGQPTINYATTNYVNAAHGFTNVYAYLTSYSGCYNNLNTGVGFVNYTAHGGETSWSDPSFTTTDVNALTNANKYFWAIGNCCLAGNFGYSSPCLAEAFIRGENKGAFAYIGACPSTYWHEDFYWSVGAHSYQPYQFPTVQGSSAGSYDACFMDDMYNTVVSAMFVGNLSVTHAHNLNYQTSVSAEYYWQAYHTFGDGSIMPYNVEPTDNMVSHLNIIPIGLDTYTVAAHPGSYVAISKDGVLHGTALVPETGSVDVPITPITSGGDAMIVVTRQQRKPYITTVPAAALEGAYLVVSNYSPNYLEFGQTANINVTLKNVGIDPTTTNTTVTFSCSDPLLTITNATATFSAMAPDEEVTVNNAFTITASTEVADKQLFTVVATIVNGDETWTSNIVIETQKPILEYDGFTWAGSFTPGESYDIMVNFKNTGGCAATNAIGTMTSSNSNVTINNATYNYGTIAPNGSVSGVFNVTIGDATPITELINLHVALAATNNITAEGEAILANSCNIVFNLFDSWGDGWNGGAKLRVTFSDGTPQEEYTCSGSSSTFIKEVNTGTTVTLTWIAGTWDSECSFTVSYEEGEMIYESSGTPSAGVLYTFVCQCSGSPVICDPITNLVVTTNDNNVTLTWNGNASSYIIKRNGIEIGTPTASNYTDLNVPAGEHNYCVIAVCSEGNSIPVCETITIAAECVPPTQLTVTSVDGNIAHLEWDATASAISYNVYADGTLLGNTTSTTFDPVINICESICFTVTSVCEGNIESDPSEETCIQILSDTYTITATAGEHGSITPAGTITINCGDNQTFSIAADAGYMIEDVIVDGLSVGAMNSFSFTNITNNHTISAVFTSNSIDEFENNVKIYPNPVKNTLFVESETAIQKINVYNALGQLVYTANNCGNITSISVENLTPGIYTLHLTGNTNTMIKKIVIQ